MQIIKQHLLDRIKKFLELPGICVESKRGVILENCAKLSFEQLCEVTAILRVRASKIASVINSPEKIHEIKKTKEELNKFFTKYGI